MRFDLNAGQPRRAQPDPKRRHGRLPMEMLQCNLGFVVDISAGGMCVIASEPLVGRLRVEIPDCPLPAELWGEVKWSKSDGHGRWEVGLEFIDLSQQLSQQLSSIARDYRLRRAV